MNIWLLHPWQTTLQFWYSKFCTRLQLPEDGSKFWFVLTIIHLNARELILLKDLNKKWIRQVWYCVVPTATATIQLKRAWSIMKGGFSAPEGIFQSQFVEIWAKRENDEKAAHAQILQVEFLWKKYQWKCWSSLLLWTATSSLLRLPYLFITSSIVTCRFSRRSCRLLTCRPSLITKANMVTGQSTLISHPTTTKDNPIITTISPRSPSAKSCRPGFEACGRSVQPLLLGCLHYCCRLYCQPV